MRKYTLEHYIPEKKLRCQCLFIKLGSMVGDIENSGITHFLEHLLVSFDKKRTDEEKKAYIIQAYTTYDYMCFIVYYNFCIVSDDMASNILQNIRRAHTIEEDLFNECKDDVIQEIKQYRQSKEKIFARIGEKEYIDKLPIGKIEQVANLTPVKIDDFIKNKYIKAKSILLNVKIKNNRYDLRTIPTMNTYSDNTYKIFNMLFYELVFWICISCINISMEKFHILMNDDKVYISVPKQYMTNLKIDLQNKKYFKTCLDYISKRYSNVCEYNLDYQIQIAGDCLLKNERIIKLCDIKNILRTRSKYWLYTKYRKYLYKFIILDIT